MSASVVPVTVTLDELNSLGDGFPVVDSIFPAVKEQFEKQAGRVQQPSRASQKVVSLLDVKRQPTQLSARPIEGEITRLDSVADLRAIFEAARDTKLIGQFSDVDFAYVQLRQIINAELHKRDSFVHIWVY